MSSQDVDGYFRYLHESNSRNKPRETKRNAQVVYINVVLEAHPALLYSFLVRGFLQHFLPAGKKLTLHQWLKKDSQDRHKSYQLHIQPL